MPRIPVSGGRSAELTSSGPSGAGPGSRPADPRAAAAPQVTGTCGWPASGNRIRTSMSQAVLTSAGTGSRGRGSQADRRRLGGAADDRPVDGKPYKVGACRWLGAGRRGQQPRSTRCGVARVAQVSGRYRPRRLSALRLTWITSPRASLWRDWDNRRCQLGRCAISAR
jgi:hypothetical protein